MRETISVIIPTYQHGRSLVQCLESMFAQSRKPDEIIVVDDGSTDNTRDLLAPYGERIKYLYQNNQGASAARMAGFKMSSGSLVIFLDADIRARSDMLERLEIGLRDDSEASWAYSSFRWGWKRFPSQDFDPEKLKEVNYIHSSALIRRKDFPGFDSDLKRFQDWDLWLTMSEQGRVGVFVPEELFQVVHVRGRKGMSTWLPSIAYKLPWKLPAVRDYERARKIVLDKHRL